MSTSVYEHLSDVNGITRALHSVLKPGGFFVAYVDLRDHYFKYPFEMLTFAPGTWKRWLNPTSNLNRFRLRYYRQVFASYFARLDIEVIERDEENFEKAHARIRHEFLTGNRMDDCATQICVLGWK